MRDRALATAELTIKAAHAFGRDDLVTRLGLLRQRLVDPAIQVLVVGEFKQGKSSLINSLLNAPVCPVDDDLATSVPTAIQYSAEPFAVAIHEPHDGEEEPFAESIPISRLPVWCTEAGNPANSRRLRSVEIGVPRQILQSGLVLVDTPGAGGLASRGMATTLGALPLADAIIFVSDASQEFSGPELDFVDAAREVCPSIEFVLTKTDIYPEWRRILELDTEHLRRRSIEAEIIPTSATLRQRAVRIEDRSMNMESGYPQLIDLIRRHVLTRADQLAVEAAALILERAVDQLEDALTAEKQVLEDPATAASLKQRLEEAKKRAEELKTRSARWQVTLSDGIADLNADVDHRLRERMRSIVREAEIAIDDNDPGKIWDEFEGWLRRRVMQDVAGTYADLSERTVELSQEVAQHFDDDQPAEVALDLTAPLERLSNVETRAAVEPVKLGMGGVGITAIRGSYSGYLMFGMLGQLAGLALLNPATAVVGLLMGRKALRDERHRLLTIKRQQAKTTVRQFVDDASFQVGKELKDALRRVHRALRDEYTSTAEELNRSLSESMAGAGEALKVGSADRARRLADVAAELARLERLREQVRALDRLDAPVTDAA